MISGTNGEASSTRDTHRAGTTSRACKAPAGEILTAIVPAIGQVALLFENIRDRRYGTSR